jgi:hypothetical protein
MSENKRLELDVNNSAESETFSVDQNGQQAAVIADKLLRCGYKIQHQLKQLDAQLKACAKGFANGKATAMPVVSKSQMTSRSRTDPWEPLRQEIDSLVRTGFAPTCKNAAKFAIAALRRDLLPELAEAHTEIVILDNIPSTSEELCAFWSYSIVRPMRLRYPKHYLRNDESDGDRSESSEPDVDCFDAEDRSDVLKCHEDHSDPRSEYALWPRTCKILALFIRQNYQRQAERSRISATAHSKVDDLSSSEVFALIDMIDLDQAAALVSRHKRTLHRYQKDPSKGMPLPQIQGAGGKKSEWRYATLKPWLEKWFDRQLPPRPPHVYR